MSKRNQKIKINFDSVISSIEQRRKSKINVKSIIKLETLNQYYIYLLIFNLQIYRTIYYKYNYYN